LNRLWLSSKEHCYDEQITVTPRVCTNTGITETYDDIRDGRNFGVKTRERRACTRAVTEPTGNRICETRTTSYTWHGCTGVMNKTCGTELQELSTTLSTTRSTINELSTAGNTYLPSGVMWGWRTLQAAEPLNTNVNLSKPGFPEIEAAKVMIFMTDGANTLTQGGSEPHLHEGGQGPEADARTRNICEAAKAEGVQIFTIGYRMQNAVGDAKSVLLDCATNPANYYDASDANALKSAFQDIAGQLSLPRLSI